MTYRVKLDFFEGPLDLLLHLVRKNEVDILDIPIAIITHQYLEYIRWMKELNLEVAGDFLLMAATLIQIKARTLLPSSQGEASGDEGEGDDPRQELARRLVEYQRFREAGQMLERHHQLERDVFRRGSVGRDLAVWDTEFKEVSVFALADAFRRLLENLDQKDTFRVDTTQLSVRDKMKELMEKLRQQRELSFEALFSPSPTRLEIVTSFLALLELMRLRLIKVYQAVSLGVIRIILADENGKNTETVQ